VSSIQNTQEFLARHEEERRRLAEAKQSEALDAAANQPKPKPKHRLQTFNRSPRESILHGTYGHAALQNDIARQKREALATQGPQAPRYTRGSTVGMDERGSRSGSSQASGSQQPINLSETNTRLDKLVSVMADVLAEVKKNGSQKTPAPQITVNPAKPETRARLVSTGYDRRNRV
jgi:hypothetical protein